MTVTITVRFTCMITIVTVEIYIHYSSLMNLNALLLKGLI
jgi:hypothetical protein